MNVFLEHLWNTRGLFCDIVGTIKYYYGLSGLKTLSSDGFVAGHLKKVCLAHNKSRRKLEQVRFLKNLLQKVFMLTNPLRKKILVLCDHDALYSAIEMQLSGLHQTSIVRSALTLPNPANAMPLFEDVDLIILATVSPMGDLVPAFMDLLPRSQVGKPLVLIISEHLSVSASDDRITFLDFPFDMDGLPLTVTKILGSVSSTGP